MSRHLFVTPVSPFSHASGAEQRSALLLQALRQVGTVDVLQMAPGKATRVWREEAAAQRESLHDTVHAEVGAADGMRRYRPKPELTRAVERAFGRPLSAYGLIMGRYVWSLCQLELPPGVATLIDLDDFRYRYGSEAGWSPALVKERVVKALNHRLARRQLRRFDAAFVVSERDKTLLNGMPSCLLPNVPWSVPETVTPVPADKRVLFVGSLWYRPNADGIDWFLAKVWPAIRVAEPSATLQLVGSAAAGRRAGWERHAGVSAPGFVDDLAAAYASASLVVVPVHSGGGSNIKLLEALAHGRPCVATRVVSEAFGPALNDGMDLLVAERADDFATACVRLMQAPQLLQTTTARTKMRKLYDRQAMSDIAKEFALKARMNKSAEAARAGDR